MVRYSRDNLPLQRTYEWVKSWGMLESTATPLALVNRDIQKHAHQAA
jgi:hypothetical protein